MPNLVVKTNLDPHGLLNMGNTCFLNATVQCILSLPKVIFYFKKGTFNEKKQPISYAFQKFIYAYQKAELVDTSDFVNSLKKKINIINGSQQDAFDFFVAFINLIYDEIKDNSFKDLFSIKYEDYVQCEYCKHINVVDVDTSFLYLFINKTVTQSLDDFLNKKENTDENTNFYCEKCKRKSDVCIRHKIKCTGEYFIIHLNRFENMFSKNRRSIEIDKNININRKTYEIIGVSCHMGDLKSGHYISFAKRENNFYKFNDTLIEKADLNINNEQPYILFYKLKKNC